MSHLASAALQTAIHARLTGDPVLAATVTGVFDRIPEPASFPFILLGVAGVSDWSTKTFHGQRHTVTLQVFARDSGELALRQLADLVSASMLSAPLEADGQETVGPFFDSLQTLADADGVRQARLRFIVFTQAGAGQ